MCRADEMRVGEDGGYDCSGDGLSTRENTQARRENRLKIRTAGREEHRSEGGRERERHTTSQDLVGAVGFSFSFFDPQLIDGFRAIPGMWPLACAARFKSCCGPNRSISASIEGGLGIFDNIE